MREEKKMNFIKAIDNLTGNLTIISVAHRLSTIVNSDKIYNLESGQIIESGTYSELVNNKKNFYKTLQRQKVI